MEGQYNLRSPAVKRLMKEAQELAEPTEQYYAQPLEDNLFEWHFTIRGPSDSDFQGGIYHGRIILPPDYPMKPPSIMFLTPNGRFDCFTKICLSISKHHPESWQPSWSIRTALLAIIGFMPSPGHGAIGSLDYTSNERQSLARRSSSFTCEQCGPCVDKVLPLTSKSEETKKEISDLAAQLSMSVSKTKHSVTTDSTTVSDSSSQDSTQSPLVSHTEDQQQVPPLGDVRQRVVTPTATTASNHTQSDVSSTQSLTSSRSTDATQSTVRSRSCMDSLTYWSIIIIILLLTFLVLRRVITSNYIVTLTDDSDDL